MVGLESTAVTTRPVTTPLTSDKVPTVGVLCLETRPKVRLSSRVEPPAMRREPAQRGREERQALACSRRALDLSSISCWDVECKVAHDGDFAVLDRGEDCSHEVQLDCVRLGIGEREGVGRGEARECWAA